jgi:hypothetical protein
VLTHVADDDTGLPPLPFPLSLMSKKEKVSYICNLVSAEAKDQKVKAVYGSAAWQPSFWLEHAWSWTNLNQTLSKTKEEMFTGEGSWSDFLSKTIRARLEEAELDPEMYVENIECKESTIKKKKRARGIFDGPEIIKNRHEECRKRQLEIEADGMLPAELPNSNTILNLTPVSGTFPHNHDDFTAAGYVKRIICR